MDPDASTLIATLLLGTAAYRSYRLAAIDDLTAPLRARVHLSDEMYEAWSELIEDVKADGMDPWRPGVQEGGGDVLAIPPFSERRYYAARFARCPWCIGAWISIVWWAGYLAAPGVTIAVAMLATMSAIVGLVETNLDKE